MSGLKQVTTQPKALQQAQPEVLQQVPRHEEQPKALLLMVSGGSDSMALLEKFGMQKNCKVLHVNHMLRGAQADSDEEFVRHICKQKNIPFEVKRIDVAALAVEKHLCTEAAARLARYRVADEVLDVWCAHCGCKASEGIIYTAHTLDDRIETFYMRSLVGTGPGGLASIPRKRGRIERPLLDCLREELRDFLRSIYPKKSDEELWHEDLTNTDGSNFRSRIRMQLMPVLRLLRPNFEHSLARTMDLIAQEDEFQLAQAQKLLLLNLTWEGQVAKLPREALSNVSKPMQRRVLREALLMVNADARIESVQIERILDGYQRSGFCTEVDLGIKVKSDGNFVSMFL